MDRNSHARAPDAQLNLAWWLDQLEACANAEDALKVAREFSGAWQREKLDMLPQDCQPNRLETPHDVSALAYCLARAQMTGMHRAPHIHALAMFFTAANAKLSRLLTVYPADMPRIFGAN